MADAVSQPGSMISTPPPDRTAGPVQTAPQVNVSWPEFLILRWLPEKVQAAYLVRRLAFNISRTHRDPNAQCPACGNCKGEIRWAEAFTWPDSKAGALVHLCAICKATWGERPIIAFESWKITLRREEERTLFGEVMRGA